MIDSSLTALVPLQLGGVQVVGGFLVIATLSTLLANTAVYYVTGDVDLPRAIVPGVAMTVVGLGAALLPVPLVVVAALVVDFVVVSVVYEFDRRRTAMVTAAHFTLIVVVAYLVNSLLAIYQTAPI